METTYHISDFSGVLIIGTVPRTAGLGGVTIHVERLLGSIAARVAEGADTLVPSLLCDYKKESRPAQLRRIRRARVVHIHVSHPLLRLYYVLACKLLGARSILTVHGNLGRFSAFKNAIDRWAVTLCDVPVLINEGSYRKGKAWNRNAVLLPAFIPPLREEPLPAEVRELLEQKRAEGCRIFATNASGRISTPQGQDIYGIPFLVDYFSKRRDSFLFISDPTAAYYALYDHESPAPNIRFIPFPHSFYALTKEADVVVRATATDGDSLSVKEALHLGKPVVATDCVSRPEGTFLFSYGEAASLSKAIEKTSHFQNQQSWEAVDCVEEYCKLYVKLK